MENATRSLRQAVVLGKWKKNKAKGTFTGCTGFGKTRVGLNAIHEMLQRNRNRKTIVVVPTLPIKESWLSKVKKRQLEHVFVDTVHSWIKKQNSCNLLILDEVHEYLKGPEFSKIMNTSYKWCLALSATISDEEERILNNHGLPVFDTVTLEEARTNNWVEDFEVFNLPVPLTPTEKIRYDKDSRVINKCFERFGWDFDLVYAVQGKQLWEMSPGEYVPADHFATSLPINKGFISVDQIRAFSYALTSAIKNRQRLIASCHNKMKAMELFIRDFPEIKKISFSKFTEQADVLYDYARGLKQTSMVYHSKKQKTPKQKTLALQNYSRVKHNFASTVAALNQGYDAPWLQLGLVNGGTSKKRVLVQRIGRVVRLGDGYAAVVFIYPRHTIEEKKVIEAQSGMTVKYMRYKRLRTYLKNRYNAR